MCNIPFCCNSWYTCSSTCSVLFKWHSTRLKRSNTGKENHTEFDKDNAKKHKGCCNKQKKSRSTPTPSGAVYILRSQNRTTWCTAATVACDGNELKPLTKADMLAIVNAVFEAHQPSATGNDILLDHTPPTHPRTLLLPPAVFLLHPKAKDLVRILLILVNLHLYCVYFLYNQGYGYSVIE